MRQNFHGFNFNFSAILLFRLKFEKTFRNGNYFNCFLRALIFGFDRFGGAFRAPRFSISHAFAAHDFDNFFDNFCGNRDFRSGDFFLFKRLAKNLKRFWEIFPAAISWSAILFPIFFSFHFPILVETFIVAFSIMWLARAIEFCFFLIFSFLKFQNSRRENWHRKMENWEKNKNLKIEEKKLRAKLEKNNQFLKPSEVLHLIIVPTFREEISILETTFAALKNSNFDSKKLIVCLATEERDAKLGNENARILRKKFGGIFGEFLHFQHPANLKNEVVGKGANISFAGKKCAEFLQNKNYNFAKILTTTLDADNCVSKNYFANLTFKFCATENRQNCSFQPLAFFSKNIWQVPIFNRLVALSSTFWHMILNAKISRLRNFASHAQPFGSLVKMNFWSRKTIVEDGHQFWRSLFYFHGNYRVVPIFSPIYFDAFCGRTFFRSIRGQFLQLRRWAWGCSDISFVAKNWRKKFSKMPFGKTCVHFFRLIEGHFMWATAPILITLTTPIPRMVNFEFQKTVFAANASFLVGKVFSLALFGIFTAMFISFLIIPRPKTFWQKISMFAQWIFFPFTTVAFGAAASLTAQTILASGKKLEFNVTEKVRLEN